MNDCPRDASGFCHVALVGACQWRPERPDCGALAKRLAASRDALVEHCAARGRALKAGVMHD